MLSNDKLHNLKHHCETFIEALEGRGDYSDYEGTLQAVIDTLAGVMSSIEDQEVTASEMADLVDAAEDIKQLSYDIAETVENDDLIRSSIEGMKEVLA